MVNVLQDIWVLSESGLVLFHRMFDEKMDEQLFGALMCALNTFAEELSKGGLSNFELSHKRFTILKQYELIFIATSNSKVKHKKVADELELIAQKFYSQYCLILENWDGEMNHFSTFGEEIEDSLEMDVQKFHQAFF